jgi:hypothetical protein
MLPRLLLFITVSFISCKRSPKPSIDKQADTYFSVKQFVDDQWKTFHGQPFGMIQIVSIDGKQDTILTNAYAVDWAAIIRPFFESDISNKKFLGQYTFSSFPEESTESINLYYEANNPKLFTRKLIIIIDDVNAKIKSIYVETEKRTRWNTTTQKLFYIPVKLISIQEFERSTPGPTKEVRVAYRFL